MPRSQPWACSPPQVMKESASELAHPPAEGCYIHGLFLEGARWDPSAFQLAESRPKELYTEMAVIWLLPVPSRKPPATGIYLCPIYKTLTRAGRCPEDRPLKTEPIELARTDSPGEAAGALLPPAVHWYWSKEKRDCACSGCGVEPSP